MEGAVLDMEIGGRGHRGADRHEPRTESFPSILNRRSTADKPHRRRVALFEIAIFRDVCYNRLQRIHAPIELFDRPSNQKEFVMGKGNNSQKNDKKSKKPKQDKKAAPKPGGK